jgi:hypothetical protein
MDKVYYAADVYSLSMRHVVGEEKRRLENRMKWVLTGEENYWQDSEAIGRETGVMKQNEKAEKKMQGKKRKGKRSKFYQRPDKTKTEKRRALSGLKTDTKIDMDHILFGASNNYEEEAEDSEMECEDAECKKHITIMIILYRKLPQVRRQELEDDGAEMPLSLTLMAHL